MKYLFTLIGLWAAFAFTGCSSTPLEKKREKVLDCTKDLIGHDAYPVEAQADAYRRRKAGMSDWLRVGVNLVVGKLLAMRDWDISTIAKIRAVRLARRHGCDTIVCGHWHPKTIKDFKFRGIRIVVLPRGRTDLYL